MGFEDQDQCQCSLQSSRSDVDIHKTTKINKNCSWRFS